MTGFALCPKDGDTAKLIKKMESVSLFGDAPVEKAISQITYRMNNKPQKYGALEYINEEWKYCLKFITAKAPNEALATTAGVVPVVIAASRDNYANPKFLSAI